MSSTQQEQVIVAKIETNYGVDATPAAANDAFIVSNLKHTALDGSTEERNNMTGFLGNQGNIRTGSFVRVEFEVELGGSGIVDVAPPWSVFYRASALALAVNTGVDVSVTPIDASYESLTIYYYAGDVLHSAVGCRGTVKWKLGTDGIPKAVFTFIGLYQTPSKVSKPSATFPTVQIPLAVNKANVPVMTFFGQSVSMKTLEVDAGNEVEYDQVVNDESVNMTGRGNGKVNIKFREPDLAVINFFDLAEKSQYGAMAYQLGTDVTDAGNIFEMSVPNIQVSSVERVYEKNISYLQISGDIVPIARNLDFTVVHR